MKLLTLGRILFGLPFIGFGLIHLFNVNTPILMDIVPSYLPMPAFWVGFVGVAFLASGLALVFNKGASRAALWLGIMLVLLVVLVQVPRLKNGSLPFVLKDSALAGAAFFMAAVLKEHHARKHAAHSIPHEQQ